MDELLTMKEPYGNSVEIGFMKDNKEMTIGEKRSLLYETCPATYSVQVDDDDLLHPLFFEMVMPYCKAGEVDCITYREHCMINGECFSSNHSIRYADWGTNQDGFDFVRTPFFKDLIRTSIAKSVPVPHIRFGEDHEWSKLIKPHLKTEAHIDKELYIYIHEPSDPTERYGLNK